MRGSEFSRFVLNKPERYETALAAVAKEGYSSGRKYWEVRVASRSCYVVGVAKESAERKSDITYGPKHGYWGILKKKDGTYQALTDRRTTLKLSRHLSVIGVLLDFNKGEIAFYDANTKTPVFTFSDLASTEKLYPYIETCTDQSKDDPPIVISDVQSVVWLEGH